MIKLVHRSYLCRGIRYNVLAKYFVTHSDWFMVLVLLGSMEFTWVLFLERASGVGEEGQRERERENLKQAPHLELSVKPDIGLNPTILRS